MEHLGRPASPGQRPAADRKQESGIPECIVTDPRYPPIWSPTPLKGEILKMLGKDKRTRLENQDPPAVSVIVKEEPRCDYGAEGAATDHDDIEFARSASYANSGAIDRLLQCIA